MHDPPTPAELIGAVARFMRTPVPPEAAPHAAFITRVAANGLDIARRELENSPADNAAELARLQVLLGSGSQDLEALNRDLCARLEAGTLTLATPGLSDHLWAVTMAKLAVDQPNYSGYRAALAERSAT